MTHDPAPPEQLSRMITGYWISQALYVAAKLGVADRLASGSSTADELAESVGAHGRTLYRILRALASVGVFSEDAEGRFSLTPLAEGLRRDVDGSQWALAIMMGEERYRCWGDLLESARTGQAAFERLYGQPPFAYLADRPEQAQIFDAAMTGVHGRETRAVLDAYDFSGIGTLADIGGGNGSTLIGILERNPGMRGILFDLPGVVDRAEFAIEGAGLSGRCERVRGSFFDAVPAGADAYLLRHIVHDWNDDKALAILGNLRRAMGASARLLIVESVIPAGNGPSFGKFLDLAMLLGHGGMERTEGEYARLLGSAGFLIRRIVPTSAEVCVIEAERA